MSFNPHPAQVQAVRTAKRFREGFRPAKINGNLVPPTSVLRGLRFRQVPSQVLCAEMGHLCTPGERVRFLDALCDRGYLRKQDGYPKCEWAPMEYQTEDGARVLVHDKDWSEIDVLRPDAVLPNGKGRVQHYVSGTQGRIVITVNAAAGERATGAGGSRRDRKMDKGGPGSCFELAPDGYRLLDQHESAEEPGSGKSKSKPPAWERLTLHRSSDGSDHNADLDGKRIRIRGDAAYKMLDVLQRKKGERVKAAVLQHEIHQRPDRLLKLLDQRLQRIIDPPKKGVGYAML